MERKVTSKYFINVVKMHVLGNDGATIRVNELRTGYTGDIPATIHFKVFGISISCLKTQELIYTKL
jgi:hypothetical protein